MKKSYLLVGISLLLALAAGCKNDVKKGQPGGEAPEVVSQGAGISGTVAETLEASGYTYVLVDTGADKVWIAGPKSQVKVGDEVFVPEGSTIDNFESKTLGRTFESIIFASSIVVGGADQAFAPAQGAPAATPAPPQVVTDFSGLAKPEGGKTVAEVYGQKAGLNGQKVKIRAKVVKFMSGIMGKNWLHIKDGTGTTGTDDLVVTTQGAAKIGDKVLIDGTVTVDKDFGSGYRYDVIVEDAEVIVE